MQDLKIYFYKNPYKQFKGKSQSEENEMARNILIENM
jgi:hypothetical protein